MDSRAQLIKMTDPAEPDTQARIAGRDLYGTIVGSLRRVELWRLANLWGMQFPAGASKDYMLPFFMQLEAEGKNPLRPPGMVVETTADLRSRNVKFAPQNHAEFEMVVAHPDTGEPVAVKDGLLVQPNPKSDFEAKLEKLHHGQLKKICKMRGIPQTVKDRKADLIARIVAASEGIDFEQDLT
jgi:hypothetical protein